MTLIPELGDQKLSGLSDGLFPHRQTLSDSHLQYINYTSIVNIVYLNPSFLTAFVLIQILLLED